MFAESYRVASKVPDFLNHAVSQNNMRNVHSVIFVSNDAFNSGKETRSLSASMCAGCFHFKTMQIALNLSNNLPNVNRKKPSIIKR